MAMPTTPETEAERERETPEEQQELAGLVAQTEPRLVVIKPYESNQLRNIEDAIRNRQVQLVFNTTDSQKAVSDSKSIRRATLMQKVPYYTTLSGAAAAASCCWPTASAPNGCTRRSCPAGTGSPRFIDSGYGAHAASLFTPPPRRLSSELTKASVWTFWAQAIASASTA